MRKILLFAAAAFMLFACSKEDNAPQGALQKNDAERHIFYASTEDTAPGTKIYADENLNVLWNENDSISLFLSRTYNDLYIFDGEDGDNSGGFEEIPPATFFTYSPLDHFFAVYPYSKSTQINNKGTQITVNLPSVQRYKEHSFGIGANTMVAVTDDNFLPFKNVCGYLKFRFWGENVKVKSVKLEGNNGEKIAGKAYVTPSLTSAPTVSMDEAATSSITINCTTPVQIGTSSSNYTEFIFVIPPTVFSGGFKVTVTDEIGRVFEKSSTRSLTITRNKMESMGSMKVVPSYDNIFVEFDDENFESYCLLNFDDNSDGKISYTEALAVDRIDVYNKGIRSLKGIECFWNLTSLSASRNQITEIDVSHNTALERLGLASNQLSSLDISQNTALRELQCAGNSLTGLDLSHNTALEILVCSSNQLSELDLSQLTSLTYLSCSSNKLTSLNIRNNQSLEMLFCGGNLFQSLDVSGLSSLSTLDCSDHTNLINLYCDNCNLSRLLLSGSTALQILTCDNNNLSSLDLSDNTNLQYLSCYGNNFTTLDVSSCNEEMTIAAWPQTGTLSTIKVGPGRTMTYQAHEGGTYISIAPADYGTTVIIYEYEDYKTITYKEFYYVNAGSTAFESRPGSVDENLDGTWAKLQKDRNDNSQYKLILFSGAASIEFHTGASGTDAVMYVDKYIGYNDAISYDPSSKLVEFTITVNGHTYLFQIRTSKCNIPTGTIVSGATLEIEGYVKKDGAWYPNGYNTYQMLTVD